MSRLIFHSLLLLLSSFFLYGLGEEEPWLRIERCHSENCGEDRDGKYHCQGNVEYLKVTNSCVATTWGSYVRNVGYHYNNHHLNARAFEAVSNKRCRNGLGIIADRGCDADRYRSMTLKTANDSKLGSVINMTFCYDRCGVPESWKNKCAVFLLQKKKMDNNCISTGTGSHSVRAYMNVDKDGKETGNITMSLHDLQCTVDVLPTFMIKNSEFENRCYNLDNSKKVEEVASPPATPEPAPTELVIEGSCSNFKCNDCKKDVYKVTDGCVKDDERGGSYEASCTPDGAYNIDFFEDDACKTSKNISWNKVLYFSGSTTPGCYNRLLPPTFTLVITEEVFQSKTIRKHFLCPGDENCKTEKQTNPDEAFQVCKDAILILHEDGTCYPVYNFKEYDNDFAISLTVNNNENGPHKVSMYLTYDMCFGKFQPVFEHNSAMNGTCIHTKPYQRAECRGPARYNYSTWNPNGNEEGTNTSGINDKGVMGALYVLFLLSLVAL